MSNFLTHPLTIHLGIFFLAFIAVIGFSLMKISARSEKRTKKIMEEVRNKKN